MRPTIASRTAILLWKCIHVIAPVCLHCVTVVFGCYPRQLDVMRLPDIDLPEKFYILWSVCSARQWPLIEHIASASVEHWWSDHRQRRCMRFWRHDLLTYLLTWLDVGLLPYTVNLNNHSTSENDISRSVIEFHSTSRKTDLLTRAASVHVACNRCRDGRCNYCV